MQPRQPDFKGDGVGIWINLDKNGEKYLSIVVLNSVHLKAFKNKPKPKIIENNGEI